MIHFNPQDLPVPQVHQYLLGGVAPRPIALVSTMSPDGWVNLSPFSFFNAFGANPPTVAFSPARRGRDNTVKDTYNNIVATRECVIQAVTHSMVQQVSLASTEYPTGTNEFTKSGLTPILSDLVKPPRVKESPFQMECRLQQMVELGGKAGSGNLAICEVVRFHVAEDIIENGIIQPDRIDLVARMSGDYYCRANGDAVFVVRKPVKTKGIGYDQLPGFIRHSVLLSANNLAQLANVEQLPTVDEANAFLAQSPATATDPGAFERYERLGNYRQMLQAAWAEAQQGNAEAATLMVRAARVALAADDVAFAWMALLASQTPLP